MEIVNKAYKRNGTGDVYTVKNVEEGFIIFTNGAKCKTETFLSEFTEDTVVPTFEQTIISKDPNPDTFFETPYVDPLVLDQLKQVMNNPSAQLNRTVQDSPSIDLTSNKVLNSSSTPKPPIEEDNRDITTEHSQPKKDNRPAEYQVYDNVKKSETLEILIPLTIKVPKAQQVNLLNGLFKTSFVDYLADIEVNNLLKDKNKILKIVKDSLEDWLLEEEVQEKPHKKKKNKSSKVEEKKTEPVKTVTPTQVATNTSAIDAAFGMRNNNMVIIDTIKSDEELESVRAKIRELENGNLSPQVEVQILQLEETISTYLQSKK